MLLSLFCCALCLTAPSWAEAEEAWQLVDEREGVRVERRPVSGSAFEEVRATTTSDLPPDRVWRAAVDLRPDDPWQHKYVQVRRVLRSSEHDRLVYEQVRAPLVSDRDYTVHMRWHTDGRTWTLDFQLANDEGPPPPAGFVRMPRVFGAWRITPDGLGGSQIEYSCFSDPGGSLPAWIVRRHQRATTRELVLAVLGWARRH